MAASTPAVGSVPAGDEAWSPPLEPGEHVVWRGRPSRVPLALRPSDIVLLPWSLASLAIVGAWIWFVWTSGTGSLVRAYSLIFVAASLYLSVGRFAHNWYKRATTRYAVTNRRALIERGGVRRTLSARYLSAHPTLHVESGRNGRGTVVFSRSVLALGPRPRFRWHELSTAGLDGFQLYRIADVDEVVRLIRLQQGSLRLQRRRRARSLPEPSGHGRNGVDGLGGGQPPGSRPVPTPAGQAAWDAFADGGPLRDDLPD